MSEPTPEALEAVTSAVYRARWVDGMKDAKHATDKEVAKAALRAAAPYMDTYVPGQKTLELAAAMLDQSAIREARAKELEDAADAAHDRDTGMDGSAIRQAESRGFMQRYNVSAAAKWLRARASAIRDGAQ